MNHYQYLARKERYMISQLLRKGYSIRKISHLINRPASTVSREIQRNRGGRGYRFQQAHNKVIDRRSHSHSSVRIPQKTYDLIETYLCVDWSPDQISNHLRMNYGISVSIETIYQFIWADKSGGGKLYCHLRQSRKQRRKRYGSGYNYRGHLKNLVSIDKRPVIVDKKSRTGDWEIDTIVGRKHKGALISIVERKSRYTLIAKVERKEAVQVGTKATNLLLPFKDYVITITGDNGKEFACHESMTKSLETSFYFAHPYSSWERGLNENTNGLIRQYVPKGSDLLPLTDDYLNHIMDRLNNRPRKCLGYKTPKDVFFSSIGFSYSHGNRKIGQKMKSTCTVALTN